MLKGVKKVLIAFSAGPDSVCLLNALHHLYRNKLKFCLAYVNHGLRPLKVMNFEENLTKEYAQKYKLAYKLLKVKVPQTKLGIEAKAREERYKALLAYMNKIGAQRIVLGHNLDDLIETFFMNLLRGSGTRGLGSIPPVRLPLIRPILNLTKKEILQYLQKQQLPYSIDEMNRNLGFRRNLLRYKIIPELTKINPRLYEIIKREIEILRQDDEYLQKQALRVYQKIVTRDKNYLGLDIKKIMRYNKSIINRVALKVIKNLKGNLDGYESKHIEAIIGLKDKDNGKWINLPKGIYAQKEQHRIIIGPVASVKQYELTIGLNDVLEIPGRISVKTQLLSKFNLKERAPNCEVFALDEIKPPLVIRNRRAGDEIETKFGTKKVKKIYNEARIPLRKRETVMMLCDKKGILLIFGIRRAFRGFINKPRLSGMDRNKRTKKLLKVEFADLD